MKKQERLNEIINLVNKAGTVYVQDIMESMQVSDMTVRRDLIELEKQGLLIRVRNGAKSNQFLPSRELPHEEKLLKNILDVYKRQFYRLLSGAQRRSSGRWSWSLSLRPPLWLSSMDVL